MYGPWWDRRSRPAELSACLEAKGLRSTTNTTSAAYGGGHECPGRTRRCSVREHVPIAPSLGPPLGWAPQRAQSSPPRLAGSNDPDSAEEPLTELRRALVDLHGSKSVSTFARDEFYIGPIYGVTGPKVRPSQRRRHRRCEGAIRRAPCLEEALPCSRPIIKFPPAQAATRARARPTRSVPLSTLSQEDSISRRRQC